MIFIMYLFEICKFLITITVCSTLFLFNVFTYTMWKIIIELIIKKKSVIVTDYNYILCTYNKHKSICVHLVIDIQTYIFFWIKLQENNIRIIIHQYYEILF